MAENEGGDSRFLGGFLLGFLAGVLICLGVGGSLLVVTIRNQRAAADAALREAEMMLEDARLRERVERERAAAEAEARLKAAVPKARGEK